MQGETMNLVWGSVGFEISGCIPNIAGSETQETSLGLRWFVRYKFWGLFRFVFK